MTRFDGYIFSNLSLVLFSSNVYGRRFIYLKGIWGITEINVDAELQVSDAEWFDCFDGSISTFNWL